MAGESYWSAPWTDRPVEEARIFNPAFCGELIGRTVGEFCGVREAPLNMVVAFLVLPLTLHEPTREALPKKANTTFAGWIASNAALLVEFPMRVMHLRPVSREALLFATSHQVIAIETDGFVPGTKPIRRRAKVADTTEEVEKIRSAARLLGRWFAAQGKQSSILQGLGVMP